MEVTSVVNAFADLVVKYKDTGWEHQTHLSDTELKVVEDIVKAAGFDPQLITLGRLYGHYTDQDGSKTGETYCINGYFPYKVISRDGEDYMATGWLNDIFRLATAFLRNRDRLIAEVTAQVLKSVPLMPIQLTEEGDFLREYPPRPLFAGYEYFVTHTADEAKLACCVGVHDLCNGWVDRRQASKEQDVLSCRRCGLRVYFPHKVKTYGDLRKALNERFAVFPG
ncbi:hypothetical protein A3K34_01985 [candidate division WWE3 bacterium RIFOXYC1_FULL_40_10]|uniref:Uncharacterized protein n=1 Tax=candidate division WWE3 bacterium RIFOXYA2_FULL_46_9 TaxID=1802636 RepID=A0A1F4W011_UNCKA|nr:MAG: hypothetical protein A3K58_01985 [candidate division WWE3 bacterium RIFOXYB1_FULL_40_22]OGC61630.1 MAG: hypothetical protein A3K37_01985 [candidate division WWE3 bacterium RIFOXYA1_FULL_40_11]OGC62665.1 MAG: hypothetical protein A2264_02230 [candidate division WWE3 bacterium RIFOXYA2_FULL_46_9]OGC64693.1 MAG: hypothetical protein A2326_01460 [candidate division WWE3 bacterium RIFOXYB2_FULL_41_6]OGC66013.1 MAG: hypothetical protein A3K34_01985 [candidate division WWE3 bacterium RIFOXYC1_